MQVFSWRAYFKMRVISLPFWHLPTFWSIALTSHTSHFLKEKNRQAWISNVTVWFAVDGALVEGHDVLGEGPRLVAEDVLDLAELLVQGGGSSLGGRVVVCVVHLLVPFNVEAVPQPDDLHTAEGFFFCFLFLQSIPVFPFFCSFPPL